MRFVAAAKRSWPVFALVLAVSRLVGQSPPSASPPVFDSPGRISRMGVVRAQAMVDSVFLDRKINQGYIDGGDWAAYLMARLGVDPIPENTAIAVVIDSTHVEFSGRLQDLPEDARKMLGPLAALVDSSTVITAEIVQLPAAKGIAHFQLDRVRVGSFPVPEMVLRYMLLDVGEKYPALTKTGRDLFVEIPVDGQVSLVPGAIRIRILPASKP
jgi:hypothetical protein